MFYNQLKLDEKNFFETADFFDELLQKVNIIKEDRDLKNVIKVFGNTQLQYKLKDNIHYLWIPLAGFSPAEIKCYYQKNLLMIETKREKTDFGYTPININEKIEFKYNISNVETKYENGLLELVVKISEQEQRTEVKIDR